MSESAPIGRALGPYYHTHEVQDVVRRAVATLHREAGGYVSLERAAQDVLDVLYTAMLFGAFKDWKPQPASMMEFEVSDGYTVKEEA